MNEYEVLSNFEINKILSKYKSFKTFEKLINSQAPNFQLRSLQGIIIEGNNDGGTM